MVLCLVDYELADSRVWIWLTVQGGSLSKGADEVVGLHFGC